MFFADDLLLFAKANTQNCNAIKEVLEEFCGLSGQKVSQEKSKNFFSPNVPEDTREVICNQLQIKATCDLGRYLGFPILHKGRNSCAFHFVIERVQSKLEGLKSKLLSPAGRLVLIKSAATPIPGYFMQCISFPSNVYNSIDKIIKDFLWGSSPGHRKMHVVNWNKVTLPKELGRLGIVQMKARNLALLSKLCWRLASNPEAPWALMLAKKYLTPTRINSPEVYRPCSQVWTACKEGGKIFSQGLKWNVKNWRSILFWRDFWLPSGALRHQMVGPLIVNDEKLTVRDVLNSRRDLESCISFTILENILLQIKATLMASDPSMQDTLVWAFSNDGSFDLKSAYLLAKDLNLLNLNTSNGKQVWKATTTPKIKFFLWQCYHKSIPTHEVLGSRGINLDMTCELCGQATESISHVLKDCIVVQNFWKLLGITSKHHDFFLLDLEEWMKVNCSSKSTSRHHQLPWKIVFSFGIWQLWNQRNSFLFSFGTVTRNIQDLCIKKSTKLFAIVGDKPNKNPRTNIQVKWTKPPMGWLKLNTDGSNVGNLGIASGGGLICNENGDWVMGFARSLGITSGVMAELWL